MEKSFAGRRKTIHTSLTVGLESPGPAMLLCKSVDSEQGRRVALGQLDVRPRAQARGWAPASHRAQKGDSRWVTDT